MLYCSKTCTYIFIYCFSRVRIVAKERFFSRDLEKFIISVLKFLVIVISDVRLLLYESSS